MHDRSDPTVIGADWLMQQGAQQYQTGKIEAAIGSWQQARAQYQQAKNSAGEVIVLANLGAAYLNLQQYRNAIVPLEALLPLARSLRQTAKPRRRR